MERRKTLALDAAPDRGPGRAASPQGHEPQRTSIDRAPKVSAGRAASPFAAGASGWKRCPRRPRPAGVVGRTRPHTVAEGEGMGPTDSVPKVPQKEGVMVSGWKRQNDQPRNEP